MDRRFEARKQEMLAECEVSPEVFEGVQERMQTFLQPFNNLLRLPEQRECDRTCGVSPVKTGSVGKWPSCNASRV